jgi:hypothetical protein
MEGSTQVSVLILAGVCLAAIPMAAAVKALEQMLLMHRSSPAIAESAGNTPTGEFDEEILHYITPQRAMRALRYLLAGGVLILTWAAFGCLVVILVVSG